MALHTHNLQHSTLYSVHIGWMEPRGAGCDRCGRPAVAAGLPVSIGCMAPGGTWPAAHRVGGCVRRGMVCGGVCQLTHLRGSDGAAAAAGGDATRVHGMKARVHGMKAGEGSEQHKRWVRSPLFVGRWQGLVSGGGRRVSRQRVHARPTACKSTNVLAGGPGAAAAAGGTGGTGVHAAVTTHGVCM